MSCCGGQPLAYLRREVPDGLDVGLRAQDAYEVADVADAAGCGVNLEWYGVKFFCAFYFTKSQTRTYQNDINNLGGGTAAIIADGAVCGFLPLTPTWYKAVCIAIAAAYEVWTVHDIDVAVQNKGCLDFSVNLKSFFGIISGDVHPNWIGPSSRYCK
jgi:hypothetical protein